MLRSRTVVLPGLLLLAGTAVSHGQAAPGPADTLAAAPAPRRLLLKLGLTPSRLIPQYRRVGFKWVVAPSVGAEYQLGPHVTVYGQADADFAITRPGYYLAGTPEPEALVSSGAVGLGLRYYYNQAGRKKHNRAHGPFVGNYLALETTAELKRAGYADYDFAAYPNPVFLGIKYHTQVMPLLTAYWGLQRRLGRHFLYDLSAGAALVVRPIYYLGYDYYGYNRTLYRLDSSVVANIRLYVVR